MKINRPKYCECGCGTEIKSDRRFVNHHNRNIAWNKGLTKETDRRVADYSKSLEGRTISKEVAEKIRKKLKGTGKPKSPSQPCGCGCGMMTKPGRQYINFHFTKDGLPITPESVGRMRNSIVRLWQDLEYREKHLGENNPNWWGGFSLYASDWSDDLRSAIRKRDNYTCQLCTLTQEEQGRTLDVHHIDYDKENCDPNNLISLCDSCHSKTNCNRDKWISFFMGRQRIKAIEA